MPEEKLTPAEEKWARNWVSAIAELMASGPPSESPEEHAKEVEKIKKVALEPGSAVYEKARKWRRRMIEIFAPAV